MNREQNGPHRPLLADLTDREGEALCAQLRQELVEEVSKTGGHLASNLGAVELTVAIHRVFDTARDRLVFDVGHQCYPHKMITGRRRRCPLCASTAVLLAFQSRGERPRRLYRRPCLQLGGGGAGYGSGQNSDEGGL